MASRNPAAEADTQVQVAEAKAELAVVLTESFREDINGLRDALQRANQLIAALQSENAHLKAALALADPTYDPDANNQGPSTTNANANAPEEGAAAASSSSQATTRPPAAATFIRPDMQRVPPEGTIFSNGGPYSAAKTGDRATINNARLKKELNEWTGVRGYSVKIFRSKLEKKRAKLIISCVLAGAPKYRAGRAETADEQQQRRTRLQETGGAFRRQRHSKLQDCPLRFTLLEIVEGSGTFVVKHAMDANAQRCNHEPTCNTPESDEEEEALA